MHYLGHAVLSSSLKKVSHATDAMDGVKTRRIVTELQTFLRLFNDFKQFVIDFERFASPVNGK